MYKKFRKAVASSVKDLDVPEHFNWTKWLKIPSIEQKKIDLPKIRLKDTAKLNEWLKSPPNEPREFLLPKNSLQEKIRLTVLTPGEVPAERSLNIKKSRTNPVFFELIKGRPREIKLFDPESMGILYSYSNSSWSIPESVNVSIGLKKAELSEIDYLPHPPETENIDIAAPNTDSVSKEFTISYPEISEDLSKLLPEIFNIQLLSIVRLKSDEVNINSFSNLLEIIPKIYNVKLTSLDNIKVPTYFLKNITLAENRIYDLKIKKFRTAIITELNIKFPNYEILTLLFDDDIKCSDELSAIKDNLRVILSLHENKKLNLKSAGLTLCEYQKHAVEFLTKNRTAVLGGDPGIGKRVEAISAIKTLLIQGTVRSAIIICHKEDLGNAELSIAINNPVGWEGDLLKFAGGISFTTITGSPAERQFKWQKKSKIILTPSDYLFNDLSEDLIDSKRLKEFDLIVIDDVNRLKKFPLQNLIKYTSVKYLWCIAGLPAETIKEEINQIFSSDEKYRRSLTDNILHRRKSDIWKDSPEIIRKDFWLELDEAQQYEYRDALKKGLEKLREFLEIGNPYRFQANIFFLVHQLNQILNFSSEKETSPKSELLLNQLDLIARSGKKVLIFSQYDKFGIVRIETLLRKYGFKYVKYLAGMSASEMESAINSYRREKKITVFLAGLKAAGIRINLAEVPYLIHFDHWWNPASYYQTEDRVNNPEKENFRLKENLNVYTYLVRNTLEEKIRIKLSQKGLMIKNLVETLPNENVNEMITNEEWLEMLGFPDHHSTAPPPDYLEAFSLIGGDDLAHKCAGLFVKLGYRNVKVEGSPKAGDFMITGIFGENSGEIKFEAVLFTGQSVTGDEVSGFLAKRGTVRSSDKFFILTPGKFNDNIPLIREEKISLIDGHLLLKLLKQFQIF